MDQEAGKKAAAEAAAGLVKSGMVLGLGTGSTVQFLLEILAQRVKKGETIVGVPTSQRTEQECRRLGVPLAELRKHAELELTIDGADELDRQLHLIKGGGGALLREKVVAASSRSMCVIADGSKLVDLLGTTFPVPVEVVPFAEPLVHRRLAALGAKVVKRGAEGVDYVTDNGNLVLDARFSKIPDPPALERTIKMIPGVAEVGLFCGLATRAFVATEQGVQELRPMRPVAGKPL